MYISLEVHDEVLKRTFQNQIKKLPKMHPSTIGEASSGGKKTLFCYDILTN